jgi:hypothetical protein
MIRQLLLIIPPAIKSLFNFNEIAKSKSRIELSVINLPSKSMGFHNLNSNYKI